MFKKPTQDLGEEHGGIMLMLMIMEKIAKKLHKGEEIKRKHLNKIVEFLKNFADKCHHGKEENILFPELAKKSSNKKLVNELLGEHKVGRDYIRGIAESLEKYKPGNPDAIHIAINAEGYIKLLTEHIRKENIALFPTVNKQLSKKLQEEIEERFEKLEKEVIGVGKHEEYYGWLKELKRIYL
jgi:hemerythrin-like domain-containing protein